MGLNSSQDAYGRQLYDYFRGKNDGLEIVERDDGFIQANHGPKTYLSTYRDWSEREKQAMLYVKGRVLDIGCGGARHSLYLQKKGHRVLGVDVSPLAVKVAKLRGLRDARVLSITQLEASLGKFDTILMLGNNFGLFANPSRAKTLLRKFLKFANPDAMIIAESLDPYKTTEQDHLKYHEFNRKRGRVPGQVRIRVRYRKYTSPWFDYLLVSKKEMKAILEGTGWKVRRFLTTKSGTARIRAAYIGVLQREL